MIETKNPSKLYNPAVPYDVEQISIGGKRRPLMLMGGDAVVAGYFEAGVFHSVTFSQWMQLVWDSEDGRPPAYLKPVEGFCGIRTITPLIGNLPSIAFPAFVPGGKVP